MNSIFGLQIRALLGGKMEFIIVGGAPLSRETHEFIRVCLGAIVVPVIQLKQHILILLIRKGGLFDL